MLNQSNYYFNLLLTYLDQGGNNIWWSTNKIKNTKPTAQLIITGTGIEEGCIEEDCIPVCSEIIENEQQTIEEILGKQSLIYPTFNITDKLTIQLNNLFLSNTPNYLEDSCVDSSCIEEFGIWTKAIKTNTKVVIEDETYYFIKANLDGYGYAYLYSISLIHEETGEEIKVSANKGLLSPLIEIDYNVPPNFNVAITITKFDIEEIITTYKFVSNPLYLRSDFNTNLVWQPLYNNIEEVLFTIIYLLKTDLEIEDNNKLILYKNKQQVLINTLLQTITNITNDNSYNYSYIKNVTEPSLYLSLITNNQDTIDDIKINPAIYTTTNYIKEEESDLIILLLTIVLALTNNSLLETYVNRCITIDSYSLKDLVLKVIALTEAYKQNKDIYTLSIVTSTINQIEKRFLLSNNSYIESLNNPTQTIESKIYGDLFNYYVYNNKPVITSYINSQITYINNIDLYLVDYKDLATNNPIHLLILNLIETSIDTPKASSLITTVINIPINNYLNSFLLTPYKLYKEEIITTFKESIPSEFGWLSKNTPIQDTIIEAITKPLIDLYIHSKYIQESFINKDALILFYEDIFTNKKELLPLTITTDLRPIRDGLWPGSYSNNVDLEIKGYVDEEILNKLDNIKSVGIETNIVSSIDMPLIDNFDLCIDIVKLEDFRCQVDINGQLILLTDGQCDLAPPVLSILLQETNDPITQETSLQDNILLETNE